MAVISPTDLGLPPAKGQLNLSTGGGFEWSYQWKDPKNPDANFPAGTKLTLIVGTAEWNFAVTNNTAAITKSVTEADAIPGGTGFRLIFENTGAVPKVLVYGQVKRWGPR